MINPFSPTTLDVVDEHGNLTGEIKSYDTVHRDGDWHKSAHVWLINEKGDVLLQKRSKHVEVYPSMWDTSASGHIDSGETSIEAAHKELREELGIDLPEERFEFIGTVIEQFVTTGTIIPIATNNEFDDIYAVFVNEGISIQKSDLEVADLAWMHFIELEKIVASENPAYVKHVGEYKILFQLLHKKFDMLK